MILTEDILLYLDGQASPELEAKIKAWLLEDVKHQHELEAYRRIWIEAQHVKHYRNPSVSQGWAAIDSYITEPTPTRKLRWKEYVLGILIVLTAAIIVWKLTTFPPYIDVKTSPAQTDTVNLADGSKLILTPNSYVRYPRQFTDPQQRKIALYYGKALLSVAHDPSKPFYIDVYPAGVKVLGTVFEASSDSLVAKVMNREGLIRFFDLKNETRGVEVNEGQSYSFDGQEFTDETPVPEPPPPPPPPPVGRMLSIPFIIEFFQYNHPRKVIFKPYLGQTRDRVRLNLNQSLQGMIQQLDSTAVFEYTEKNGVFYINKFRGLPESTDQDE